MKCFLLSAVVVPFGIWTPSVLAQPFLVWSQTGGGNAEKSKVRINHGLLVSAAKNPNNEGVVQLAFPVEDSILVCDMSPSALLSPGLAAKYEKLKVLNGRCADGSSASVVINVGKKGSLSTTLLIAGALYFADHEDEDDDLDVYSLFKRSDVEKVEQPWSDEVVSFGEVRHRNLRGLQEDSQAFTFRLAMLTTKQYSSKFTSNTGPAGRQDVLTEIAKLMARVNGIYLRELSTMFQLIDDADKLICLDGELDCSSWANNNGITMLNSIASYMFNRGVGASKYDIGHGLTTGSGGIAGLGVLCGPYKAAGTTGLPNPQGDPFYVDYVAHEIGHQLDGDHSFRNCEGGDSQLSPGGAVEPGSGTTIMGYAGICGNTNVQSNSDPWFNSNNLVDMRAFIRGRSCGESFTIAAEPIMDTLSSCTVPKGNYVQLGGRVSNENELTSDVFFAWDRVDRGAASYLNPSVPRFTPHEPTKRSKLRFLPNLYLLSFDLVSQQLEEIHPSASDPNDVNMIFRFIGRTQYNPTAPIATFDVDLAGTFGYKDLSLTYLATEDPLKFTTTVTSLNSNDDVVLEWEGGTLTGDIEILIAINTMDEVSNYEYDSDVQDLEWQSMGFFVNSDGFATVQIPYLENPESRPVVLMIRSAGSNDCYFFDLIPNISYASLPPAPTDAPVSPAPMDAPVTPAPTDAPFTPSPTDAPVTDAPVTPAPTDALATLVTDAPVTPAPTDAPVFPVADALVTDAPVTPAPMDAPAPTDAPVTPAPTDAPITSTPTGAPITSAPTNAPVTPAPTDAPVTLAPTDAPVTPAPTDAPVTPVPTDAPVTLAPTNAPVTPAPTDAPVTLAPTDAPVTLAPTDAPVTPALTDAPVTLTPTDAPVMPAPTDAPVTPAPTVAPVTLAPTDAPITPAPTDAPVTPPATTDALVTPAPLDAPTITPTQTDAPAPVGPVMDAPVTPTQTDAPVDFPTSTPVDLATGFPVESPTDSPVDSLVDNITGFFSSIASAIVSAIGGIVAFFVGIFTFGGGSSGSGTKSSKWANRKAEFDIEDKESVLDRLLF